MAPGLAPTLSRSKIDMCSDLVGMAGFEPAASCSQSRRANQAAPHPADRSVAYRPACYRLVRSPWRPGCPRHVSQWFDRRVLWCFGARHSCEYAVGAHLAGIWSPRRSRGRSSMAEPQPSKLVMRVRFPSPAPWSQPRSGSVSAVTRNPAQEADCPLRARRVPWPCHPDQRPVRGRTRCTPPAV